MKKLSALAFSLAYIAVLASLLTSCSSDPNPVDFIRTDGYSKDAKTYIQLSLNPAATRAGDEDIISKVNLYVFDCSRSETNPTLEQVFKSQNVSDNKLTLELGVNPGKKIFYAITANDVFADELAGLSMTQFESKIFSSTLVKLNSSDGLVMAGKSEVVSIAKSRIENVVPVSNQFTITVQRLVAKVQVKSADLSSSLASEGFSISNDVYFKVFQTNNEMRLDNSDGFIHSFDGMSSTNGTYDKYTFDNTSLSYIQAKSSTFSSVLSQYVTENIVENPVSGNTTFLSVRVQIIPSKIYTLDAYNTSLYTVSDNYSARDFYVIALVSEDNPNTIVDFYRENESIKCYSDKRSAQYEYNKTLIKGIKYVELVYNQGYAYYRVDIMDNTAQKHQIVRNKSYQIELKSLASLGVPGENYLRPADPASDLNVPSVSYVYGDSSFDVEGWKSESGQDVDLK